MVHGQNLKNTYSHGSPWPKFGNNYHSPTYIIICKWWQRLHNIERNSHDSKLGPKMNYFILWVHNSFIKTLIENLSKKICSR